MGASLSGISVSTSRSSTPRPMWRAPRARSTANSLSSRTSTKWNRSPRSSRALTSAMAHSLTRGLRVLRPAPGIPGLCFMPEDSTDSAPAFDTVGVAPYGWYKGHRVREDEIITKCWASTAARTAASSSAPTASWRWSCTPTATPATRRRRSGSRRRRRPTRSSPTPRSAAVYDRFGHAGPGGGLRAARLPRRRGHLLGLRRHLRRHLRRRRRRPARAGARRRHRDARLRITLEEAVSRRQEGDQDSPPDAACATCGGSGAAPGHAARDLPALRRPRPGDALARVPDDLHHLPGLPRRGAGRAQALRDLRRQRRRPQGGHAADRDPGRRRGRLDAAPDRGGARRRRGAASPGTSTSSCASRTTSASSATAPTCTPRSR